tara:strand:+ start:831 stop:1529 length:699 start_codon:yes stop_codon:yes gene_type:complete
MAISVDTIYQRVLALANKEQRGYITPQEFNLLANQAQMTIFESYFYTKNRSDKSEDSRADDTETSISKLLDMKLRPFTAMTAMVGGAGGKWSYPDSYQVGKLFFNGYQCHRLSINDLKRQTTSKRHVGIEPMYSDVVEGDRDIIAYNGVSTISSDLRCEAISKPIDVAWGYVVINNKALYNANTSVDFQLHDSEEDTLVDRILAMAGIVINKVGLAQTASQTVANEQNLQNV